MNGASRLLLYCQHSLGMGHLMRSYALARALAEDFAVLFVNGGRLPAGMQPPPGLRTLDLPALGMQLGGELVSHDPRYTVAQAKDARRRLLLEALAEHAPQVLLIEMFPFGRKKFADEIVPLLQRARAVRPAPLVLCSLRDILVGGRRDQQRHDDRACALVNELFDGVLVHTDPAFARLEETFRPGLRLRVPVHYTGFVAPARPDRQAGERERRILVSAGGGIVGAPLFTAAVEAHRELWSGERLPMTLVAGPFLPDADWHRLRRIAAGLQGLELQRAVPDLTRLMQRVSASLSQCGYNTAMDLLNTRVPASVVPFCSGREDEQCNRARRLARLGLVRVLEPERLSAAALAAEIRELLRFEPAPMQLDLHGAQSTAALIRRRIAAPDTRRAAATATAGA